MSVQFSSVTSFCKLRAFKQILVQHLRFQQAIETIVLVRLWLNSNN